jgi:hypothetical protein
MVPPLPGSLAFGEPHGFAGSHTASPSAAIAAIDLSPIPAEMARRCGPETTVLECELGSSRRGSHDTDMVVTGERRLKPKVRILPSLSADFKK